MVREGVETLSLDVEWSDLTRFRNATILLSLCNLLIFSNRHRRC